MARARQASRTDHLSNVAPVTLDQSRTSGGPRRGDAAAELCTKPLRPWTSASLEPSAVTPSEIKPRVASRRPRSLSCRSTSRVRAASRACTWPPCAPRWLVSRAGTRLGRSLLISRGLRAPSPRGGGRRLRQQCWRMLARRVCVDAARRRKPKIAPRSHLSFRMRSPADGSSGHGERVFGVVVLALYCAPHQK